MVAHVIGQIDVIDRDIANAFQFDLVERHFRAKGYRRQQGQLVACVDTADVQIGVSLQIPQLAGLFEHGFIGQTSRLHPGQDVIAGAVHHPHHPPHLVSCQAFGQGLDHRNSAGNRSLKADHPPLGLGGDRQFLTVMRQQRLVCRDNILACGNRGFRCQTCRAFMAPHHLDKHIDVVTPGKCNRIGFPGIV